MNTPAPADPSNGQAGARAVLQGLQARWSTLAARERRGLVLGAAVLAGFVLWSLAVAPAWRTLGSAPARLDALDTQVQQMQALALESRALRAVAPVPLDQAQAALTTATARLGAAGKLSLQGERALLTLKGVRSDALAAWLAEVRAGARARVVEANLTLTSPGVSDGSLTLSLGAGR
jgi:general secretion pathway protein M